MKQVRRDFHAADLSDQERTMLEFVGSLTLDSKSLRERDVQRLREVGFDDVQILEIVQLAGWFNCITRIADALGVEVESWRAGWKDDLLAEDASQVLVEQPASAKKKA
ncbi:MAG: peroxidase [Deltaproteobacteria bacterium]|nr:peroxidase [Deltaproteobacteria bacterium]MCZ6546907.1 peroxidase [Deltaproteobacteria bacterium]MCZ6620916.1 peroxidase [Deltaproteobacteria bacterium]